MSLNRFIERDELFVNVRPKYLVSRFIDSPGSTITSDEFGFPLSLIKSMLNRMPVKYPPTWLTWMQCSAVLLMHLARSGQSSTDASNLSAMRISDLASIGVTRPRWLDVSNTTSVSPVVRSMEEDAVRRTRERETEESHLCADRLGPP